MILNEIKSDIKNTKERIIDTHTKVTTITYENGLIHLPPYKYMRDFPNKLRNERDGFLIKNLKILLKFYKKTLNTFVFMQYDSEYAVVQELLFSF